MYPIASHFFHPVKRMQERSGVLLLGWLGSPLFRRSVSQHYKVPGHVHATRMQDDKQRNQNNTTIRGMSDSQLSWEYDEGRAFLAYLIRKHSIGLRLQQLEALAQEVRIELHATFLDEDNDDQQLRMLQAVMQTNHLLRRRLLRLEAKTARMGSLFDHQSHTLPSNRVRRAVRSRPPPIVPSHHREEVVSSSSAVEALPPPIISSSSEFEEHEPTACTSSTKEVSNDSAEC